MTRSEVEATRVPGIWLRDVIKASPSNFGLFGPCPVVQAPSAAMARASWVREVTPVLRNTFRRW